jgi:simple sugar transport system ATP-binding protein
MPQSARDNMDQNPVAVSLRGISKTFPGVVANSMVDLDVRAGEVHALLGENGAGKTTLMNILIGLYQPDSGEIRLWGQTRRFRSPRDAIDAGVGMVHQHFKLVATLSVAENVVLGDRRHPFSLPMAEIIREVEKLSERYGLKVDPRAYVWQLSVGEQQRVEIIKLLYRNAAILILDEPTAVLTPQETEELFRTLRRMKEEGKAIVFISHKLREVMAIADRVTVLRGGRVVGTAHVREVTERDLARMMVGREVVEELVHAPASAGDVVLRVEAVTALNDRGLMALREVSFEVCQGEILGIAGVSGNGQRELAEVITGLRGLIGGRIVVDGEYARVRQPRWFVDRRVCHVPEDRLGEGLIGNLPVVDNAILREYRFPPISRGMLLSYRDAVSRAEFLVREFDVRTPSLDVPVRLLSGGNLQKLLLAREISYGPRILVANQPTRGLDVLATEYVHRRLLEQRDRGTAVVLISEDLDEILALSDRVLVMYEGQIMGSFRPGEISVEEIGLMMAGTPGVRRAG